MEYKLTSVEMVLLVLVHENPGINGYTINKYVKERGFSAWAGVKQSSIYNGLKKVEERGFVTSKEDISKTTKGPKGNVFTLTKSGEEALSETVKIGLSKTRENNPLFNLALSGLDILTKDETIDCLSKRVKFLESEAQRLRGKINSDILRVRLLFDRVISAIESEKIWSQKAIKQIKEES